MTPSLATLRRSSYRVALHDRFTLSAIEEPEPLRFRRVGDAADYLRQWQSNAGDMLTLRRLLGQLDRGSQIALLTDHQVVARLATFMARGALFAIESELESTRSMRLPSAIDIVVTPEAETVVAPIAAVPLPAPPEVPLLPALEDLQIEGAKVLPEVEQTLEQIDLTMAQIDKAKASLEPAPSGVPAISTAITDASSSITGTLDDL